MKKILLFAAIAVMGSAVISCSSDDHEIENSGSANDTTEATIYTVAARDSVPVTTIPPAGGPGDDPIIILPPKKP